MKNGTADRLWRWTLRVVGLIGFVVLLFLFAVTDRDVPAVWVVVLGGMMGLEQVVDWQRQRNGR